MEEKKILYREDVRKEDVQTIRAITESTGYFNEEETDIAVELIEERLAKGLASGYLFVFAEADDKTIGYSCYGHISGTRHSYDLYWIVVHDTHRGKKARIEAACGNRESHRIARRETHIRGNFIAGTVRFDENVLPQKQLHRRCGNQRLLR